ncbi:MAG: Holliday junction resolvase RuvX [Woeseiaceae bacterium]|nr:Holliday junction resolvase RuvX [Woeseiaceae bacterium]
MPDASTPATILAFDYGLRRIGVAVGQTVTGSASPLGIVDNGERGPDNARIEALVKEWRPNGIVVGMPLHADGSPGDLAPTIRAFMRDLERFGVPVTEIDERHTSQEAEAALIRARQAGSKGRISKSDIDAAAAVMIAERYLAGAV